MKTKKQIKLETARLLRKKQTKTEKILWHILRRKSLGLKFRRQHVFVGFILDFYCPSAKLGIEIDGGIHVKQKDYDIMRQKAIEDNGIKVLRFTNNEILDRPDEVLEKIMEYSSKTALSMLMERGDPAESGVGEEK